MGKFGISLREIQIDRDFRILFNDFCEAPDFRFPVTVAKRVRVIRIVLLIISLFYKNKNNLQKMQFGA